MMATVVLTLLLCIIGCALMVVAALAHLRWTFIGGALCLGLAAWGVSDMARAQSGHHGDGHAENHDWYRDLRQPDTGVSCCNGHSATSEGDCRPTRAYLNDDGLWYALLDGQWVPVPPRVVLRQLAPDGRSHICASKSGLIYCFLGGSPKS
jgi:hypothetical protein